MKILVFGNPHIEEDSIPLKLIPLLKKEFPKVEFKEFETEEELKDEGKNLILMDSVQGIKETTIIEDIEQLESQKIVSMHDFGVSHNLKLLKKIGYIESIKIIGIPQKISIEAALKQVKEKIKSISA